MILQRKLFDSSTWLPRVALFALSGLALLQSILVIEGRSFQTTDNGHKFSVQRESQKQTFTADRKLDSWIQYEYRYAVDHIIQNVLPNGAVLASPSKSHPDYYYHWVRDAGLTMDVLVQVLSDNTAQSQTSTTSSLIPLVERYATFSKGIQRVPNRSGGLGEPKWNVNGTAFNKNWGRPQNDSPAIRAYSLIRYANLLLDDSKSIRHLYKSEGFSSLIKEDLEYVAHHWRNTGFDIWEEVEGSHFYTRMVQRKALIEGAKLARRVGDTGAANYYQEQADEITRTLSQFWDNSAGYLKVTIDRTGGLDYKRSGLDVQIILAALHAGLDDGLYTPESEQHMLKRDLYSDVSLLKVLATAISLNKQFASLYPINSNGHPGIAIGRYPEDTYDGYDSNREGNPWPLATLAMSQIYFNLLNTWVKQGYIPITKITAQLFNQANIQIPSTLNGQKYITMSQHPSEFKNSVSSLLGVGDFYLDRVQVHTNQDGQMFEQWNRYTGYGQGATHLTWSYSAFVSAVRSRNQAISLLKQIV
ncbi:hypothetical protein H4219_004356 [Mycoemilia scoparia]|uniref:glucan 1,4-alpha-glucosidase n=1 Tax=Mycoemilia scoparia TaxID=417184 RepID=A0A9W8A023_9FUNG|nr:hypothetical protein H4219_004356 [Mycoemilia scoparia]